MSPLSQKLQQLLGLVTYQGVSVEVHDPVPIPGPTIKKGQAPVPKDAWNTDGSCQGRPPSWRAEAYHPNTDSIWMEDGSGQRGQWAEPRAVCTAITQDPAPAAICTDSWTVYRGLTCG